MEIDLPAADAEELPPMPFGEDFHNEDVFQDAYTDVARPQPAVSPLKMAENEAEVNKG